MSILPTHIDYEINSYLEVKFADEDQFLKDLFVKARKVPIPPIQISPTQARFMQFLIKLINAENVLEVGALFGYSAFSIAKALPDNGKVISLEYDPSFAQFVRENAVEYEHGKKVEVITCDAKEYMREYQPEKLFDLIFIDADKLSYSKYLDLALPLLRKGGIIAYDNTLAFGQITKDVIKKNEEEVFAIREFNDYFVNKENLFTAFATIGDGIALGIKLY
jgi:predicted O-methyltransferase YrrM